MRQIDYSGCFTDSPFMVHNRQNKSLIMRRGHGIQFLEGVCCLVLCSAIFGVRFGLVGQLQAQPNHTQNPLVGLLGIGYKN